MSDSNALPLKLLSKCINCDLKFTNEFEGFKTIKFYDSSQQHHDTLTLLSTADEDKNLLPNHLKDSNLVEEIKIEIIDAISYMYGVSYQHLLFSYLKTNCKSLLPKSGHSSTMTSVADNDSNVAVAMCSKCANIFERLYKVFKDFDKASSTHSTLKAAIKTFRDENRVTSNEKLDSKNPNSFRVKLEVTDTEDEVEDDCDMQADPFYDSDSINEDSNKSYIFQEVEVKKEEEDPLQDVNVDYMTNCKLELDRLDYKASSEKNDSSTSKSEVLVKRTRKKAYHILPGLDSANLLKKPQTSKVKANKINSSTNRFRWVWCCGIRHVREKGFLEHKQERHNGQDKLPCEYCQKVIPLQMMSKHLFKIHKIKFNQLNNSQPKEKIVDNEEVDNEGILDENEKDLWRGYTCEFCDTVMYFFDEFENHMTQHKKPEIGKVMFPYVYPIICCNVSLPDHKALTNHRNEKHNTKILKVQCQFCEEFVSKSYLKAHLKSHHNYVDERETYKCPKCDLVHGNLKSLTTHQIKRGHQMEVICGIDDCKKVYNTEASLRKHKRIAHLGELKYGCRFCGKLFRSQSTRHSHEDVHELEHHIVCDECGKTFKSKSNYRNHRVRHKDAKLSRENFKCADCDKCFVNRQGLKKHINAFHREDKKRIFTCEHCGKTTKNMTNMRIHYRVHDPNRIVKSKKSPKLKLLESHAESLNLTISLFPQSENQISSSHK